MEQTSGTRPRSGTLTPGMQGVETTIFVPITLQTWLWTVNGCLTLALKSSALFLLFLLWRGRQHGAMAAVCQSRQGSVNVCRHGPSYYLIALWISGNVVCTCSHSHFFLPRVETPRPRIKHSMPCYSPFFKRKKMSFFHLLNIMSRRQVSTSAFLCHH